MLQFERAAIVQGEGWRLLTGHLTHFGADHLRWDLLAFVALGVAAEFQSRSRFLITLGASALLISLGVLIAQPQFVIYRGLSGIDSALFGLVLAGVLLEGWRARHGFSLAVGGLALAGFAAKCAYELITADTVFVASSDVFAPVPLAHLIGMLTGAAVMFFAGDEKSGPHPQDQPDDSDQNQQAAEPSRGHGNDAGHFVEGLPALNGLHAPVAKNQGQAADQAKCVGDIVHIDSDVVSETGAGATTEFFMSPVSIWAFK